MQTAQGSATRVMGDEQFLDVDGIRTRFFEAGSGELVLLFHGGNFGQFENVDCADNWDLNWNGFAEQFHVIAVDKLGQGFTDNPKDDNDYTFDAVVRHAQAFIRELGIDRYHLVGHSRAGFLVTRLTMESQPAVASLTIVDSSTLAPGPNRLRGPLLANAPTPLFSRESLIWVTQAFSYSSDLLTPEWLDVRVEIGQLPKNVEAVEKMRVLDDSTFMPSLETKKAETLAWIEQGNLSTPTLLVWGKNDPSAVLDGGLKLFDIVSKGCPRNQMHIFNQAGHYCYREHPDEFVEVVAGFICHSNR